MHASCDPRHHALCVRRHRQQLRALAVGMRIDVAIIDEPVFGVDTPADLEIARQRLAPR